MWWTYIISFLLWINIFFSLYYEIYDHGEYKKGRRVKIPLVLWIIGICIYIYPIINIISYSLITFFLIIYYFISKQYKESIVICPLPKFLLKRY